jgi:hypothetical protein
MFFFPKPEQAGFTQLRDPLSDQAMYTYYQLPDLIYLPYRWSDIDKVDWLAMSHDGN